ncbi:uncharacterized protein [Battus philenor]|uniref:uncharacterized protein n=1 Tax=Battus philenor TaxID=42288 RepID=UPI0035CF85BD
MSFQEERQKNACPSRGFGLAAAAIGVGVGAALYYFLSKRPENPHGEGSTDPGWQCESLVPSLSDVSLPPDMDVDEDSELYTTISENITTDTSINEDEDDDVFSNSSHISVSDTLSLSDCDGSNEESSSMDSFSHEVTYSAVPDSDEDNFMADWFHASRLARYTLSRLSTNSEYLSETEWDITTDTDSIPEHTVARSSVSSRILGNIRAIIDSRNHSKERINEDEQTNGLGDQAFRQRPWSAEECTICFELMQTSQEVMYLPCTHRFHQACILPWLQEQQTCPNCRKRAE